MLRNHLDRRAGRRAGRRADRRAGRRVRVAGAGAVIAALVLAGCSDDEKKPTQPEPSDPTASGRGSGTLVQTSPLTGLKAKHGLPEHPVAVVKVDNTSNARPQVGLDHADLVLEELVEGGLTRLAAFFYSDMPKRVGPVRSMRDSDVGIVKPTNGALIASGGATQTVRRLKKAGLRIYSEDTGSIGYDLDPSRQTPYNRILHLKSFAKKMKGIKKAAPPPYLPFGDAPKSAGAKAPRRLTVTFSPAHRTTWKFAHGTWTRRNGETADQSDEFHADNLLVLHVRVTDAGYVDAAGSRVPKTVFEGKGKAQLFHDGRKVTGTWSKKSLPSSLRLADASGKQMSVPAGHTFVELVPRDGGGVKPG